MPLAPFLSNKAARGNLRRSSPDQKTAPVSHGFRARPVPKATTKRMINTAGVMKRRPLKNAFVGSRSARKYDRDENEQPDHPLFLDYQDCIENYRGNLQEQFGEQLDATHEDLTNQLHALKLRHENVISLHDVKVAFLSTSLADECVETTFENKTGKSMTRTSSIGERVVAVAAMLVKKKEELETAWVEWERVQEDIVQLGGHVLGANQEHRLDSGAFPTQPDKSFSRQTEVMNLDLKTQVEIMQEAVRAISRSIVSKMIVVEKDIDDQIRKEKVELLSKMWED